MDAGALLSLVLAATPVSFERALEVAFIDAAERGRVRTQCGGLATETARVGCVVDVRFQGRKAERRLGRQLFEAHGHVVGVVEGGPFDGGYRGVIQLDPELPVGSSARHLAWVAHGLDAMSTFVVGLRPAPGRTVRFDHEHLTVRFFRSRGRRTPSAYAVDDGIAYNLAGSLNTSEAAVGKLLFHEVFHLNDDRHGGWSESALGLFQRAIVARCVTSRACLAPNAPSTTTVKGGTYYAFQPGNGPGEYAAELAIRYLDEQRAARVGRVRKPFKCGPAPNGDAWRLLVDEFFGGADAVPACR